MVCRNLYLYPLKSPPSSLCVLWCQASGRSAKKSSKMEASSKQSWRGKNNPSPHFQNNSVIQFSFLKNYNFFFFFKEKSLRTLILDTKERKGELCMWKNRMWIPREKSRVEWEEPGLRVRHTWMPSVVHQSCSHVRDWGWEAGRKLAMIIKGDIEASLEGSSVSWLWWSRESSHMIQLHRTKHTHTSVCNRLEI